MAKKTTRRKPAVKKKTATKEAEFEVQVKDTSPGAKIPSRATTVDAYSPDAAIKTATGNKPATGAEVVTVRKTDPAAKAPPVTVGESKKPTMKAITESVNYPYSFSVPKTFSDFLSKEGLEFSSVGHNVMVRFENKSQLTEALRALNKSKSPKASIILDGIGRNI